MSRGLLRAMTRPYVELDFTRMALDSRVAFARSSDAWRWNAAGGLVQEASNAWRKHHDPLTGEVLGLLVEEQRTNLQTRSVSSDGTTGVIGSGGVLPTGWGIPAALGLSVEVLATNIDPALGGCRVRVYGTATSGGTFRMVVAPNCSGTVGQTYAVSHFARIVGGSNTAGLGIHGVNSGSLNSGTTGRIQAAASLAASRLIGSPATISSSALSNELRFAVTNGASYDFTVEVVGGQTENSPFPSSYIPTTTAAVTRAADYATVTDLSTLRFNAAAGALSVTARAPIYLAQAVTLLSYNDNTTGNVIRFRMESGGVLKAEVIAGGVTQASLALGTLTAGAQFRAAMSYAANDIRGCLNGGAIQSDTSASIPTVSRLMIGRGASGEWWNSTIRRHRYWPRALSNEELQRASA